MAEKQITSRQKATDAVYKSVVTHSEITGRAWAKRYTPYLEEGETMPDMALAMKLVGREMVATTTVMVEASEDHERELADDTLPRKKRDERKNKLLKKVVDVRDSINSVLGQGALKALGISGRTPQEPVALIKTAKKMAKGLEDEEVKLPGPRVKGITLDRVVLAGELRELINPLQEALDVVGLEERQAEQTLSKKWASIDQNDETFGDGSRWLEQTLYIAGQDDIADKVRSSKSKPGRLDESDDDENKNATT